MDTQKSGDVLFGKGAPYNSENFTGEAYLNRLTDADSGCPVCNVTFAAGCRNSWHTHPGGQVLLVTEGRGWYVEEGKPPVSLLPGTVITVPANVRHWHGAAKDSALTHISIETNAERGAAVWMEPVADEEYFVLP